MAKSLFPRQPTDGAFYKNPPRRSGNLDSNQLLQIADEQGVGNEARDVIAGRGEDPKEIFSGGLLMDFFDGLNALQYGIVGMIKGKSFSEGVKTRASFSDDDALGNHGIPGVIGGIAMDILFDPLTYLPPAWFLFGGKHASKVAKAAIPGVKAWKGIPAAHKAATALKGAFEISMEASGKGLTKVVPKLANSKAALAAQWTTNKILGAMGSDKVFGDLITKSTVMQARAKKELLRLGKVFAAGGDEVRQKIPQMFQRMADGSMGIIPKADLPKLFKGDSLKAAEGMWDFSVEYQKLAKDLGIITDVNESYMLNAYEHYLEEGAEGIFRASGKRIPAVKGRKLIYETPEAIEGRIAKFVEDFTKKGEKEIQKGYEVLRKAVNAQDPEGVAKAQKSLDNIISKQTDGLAKGKSAIIEAAEENRAWVAAERIRLGENTTSLEPFFMGVMDNIKRVHEAEMYRGLAKTHGMTDEMFVKLGIGKEGYTKLGGKLPQEVGLKTVAEEVAEGGALKVGDKVTALDSGNVGKILNIGDVSSEVSFYNKELGTRTTKLISNKQLVKGAKKKTVQNFIAGKKTIKGVPKGVQPLGDLAGMYVPDYMAEYINEINRAPTKWEALASKLWGFFKWGKTAGNPAGHARNIISNRILNFWKLGMHPLNPRTWQAEYMAKNKKHSQKYIDEIAEIGGAWGVDTFASNELRHLFRGPDFAEGMKGISGRVKGAIKGMMEKTGDFYQWAESDAKLAGYIYNRKFRKMIPDEAWRLAESATFDYNAVGSLIRKTRESIWGVPFLTFGVKAAPLVAETALKHPGRISILGKIRNNIENMSGLKETTRERQNEPPWLRDGFYIKMPLKDKHGRSAYFDLTYIIPFGDLASGQFFERQINRETGLKESFVEAMIKKAPVLNLITEIGKNQDFYGNKIWKESDSSESQIADLTRHITKMWMPPNIADTLPGGHIMMGKNKGKRRPPIQSRPGASEGTQFRTGVQEVIRNFGLKVQPIDVDLQEKFSEWDKQKALSTFLGERGLIGEFTRNYKIKK